MCPFPLMYDPTRWTQERDLPTPNSDLPQQPDDFVARLQHEFDEVAQRAERGLPRNDFVDDPSHNRLHLKRRDALELPPDSTTAPYHRGARCPSCGSRTS